jgi:hypothetical protein
MVFYKLNSALADLDNWPIDGGKVVSPTRRPHFTPRDSFLLEAESTPGP